MTNISYYGLDAVLEEGLEEKIEGGIQELLSKDDGFTFYFLMEDEFSSCIHAAVQRAKAGRKELSIKTVLVAIHSREGGDCKKFDEVLLLPNLRENAHFTVNVNRAQRWVIEQADYLLMYSYPEIDPRRQILNLIGKRRESGKLSILDLTEGSMIPGIIQQQVPRLRERLRFAHREIMSGKAVIELAKEMSVSPSRGRELYRESCGRLFYLTNRAIKKQQKDVEGQLKRDVEKKIVLEEKSI